MQFIVFRVIYRNKFLHTWKLDRKLNQWNEYIIKVQLGFLCGRLSLSKIIEKSSKTTVSIDAVRRDPRAQAGVIFFKCIIEIWRKSTTSKLIKFFRNPKIMLKKQKAYFS